MRNKIFAILFSALFLFMLVGAPATLILTKYGVLEYNNVGNEIVADKTYDENTVLGKVFTKIEEGKVKIKDTYINNLPFFLKITNAYKPFKSSVDQPIINWLQEKGNESTVYQCYHVWVDETKLATCTDEGYVAKTCKLCGETEKTEVTAALGHAFEETSKTEVSCDSDGYTLMTCTVCNAVEQRDVVEALGHDYVQINETPATCQAKGAIDFACSRCDSIYTRTLEMLSHSFVDGVCTECGEKPVAEAPTEPGDPDAPIDIPDTPIDTPDEPLVPQEPDHVHSHAKTVVAPTCTAEGYDKFTCACGDSYTENRIPPAGHKYVSTVVTATCTAEGYTNKVCSVCGDAQKTDVVAAKGHSYTVTTVAPTYTDEGYDLHTCSVCGDSFKDNTVPVLENIIPEPKTTADPEGMTYTASLKTTDSIFRHYAITASTPGGPNKTTYARIVKLDREELRTNMLDVVKMVNAMVEKDRNVNWYFSFATNIEATEIGTKIMPQESTRHVYEEFLTKIDPSVKVSAVEINSFTDYYDKFYITDHHWNHHGSEEAYMNIVRMLRENYPDIEPVEVDEIYEFENVQFFGSLSRAHANYDVWDTFGVYYRSLPSHDVERDTAVGYGSKSSQSVNLKTYKNDEFNTARGYNHYTEFYRVAKEIKYRNNNTGRNLLLIGDSYSLPLLEVVASHFDKTFVRYEDRNWNNFPEELIYDTFIVENNITDVIVIEEMSKCIMQGYGTAYPSGFLNIFPDENW